jgi:hypothetical protein
MFEVPSESGGTYRLERVSDDEHVLALREPGRPTAITSIGAAIGALFAGGLAVLLLPVRGAPDGLTPTRGELWLPALVAGGALGAVLGGLAAYALATRALRAHRLRLEVILGERVVIDGLDAGALERIESHPASSIVLVITERETLRLTLASAADAGALASTLRRRCAPGTALVDAR